MNPTTKQIMGVLALCESIVDAIKDAGPQGVPSGPLYAALMAHMSLEQYQTLIRILVKAGRITESNHVLTAIPHPSLAVN